MITRYDDIIRIPDLLPARSAIAGGFQDRVRSSAWHGSMKTLADIGRDLPVRVTAGAGGRVPVR
jgi:hypothetical protein